MPEHPVPPAADSGARTGRRHGARAAVVVTAALLLCTGAIAIAAARDASLLAIAAYVTTNLDGFVVLAAFYTIDRAAGTRSALRISLGQFIGVAALVAASLLAGSLLAGVPQGVVAWLAAVPIGAGVWALVRRAAGDRPLRTAVPPRRRPVGGVVAVVLSNGADNIAICTPLFQHAGPDEVAAAVAVFACLTAIWCAAAYAASHVVPSGRGMAGVLYRLMPFGYIAIGTLIIVRATTG